VPSYKKYQLVLHLTDPNANIIGFGLALKSNDVYKVARMPPFPRKSTEKFLRNPANKQMTMKM